MRKVAVIGGLLVLLVGCSVRSQPTPSQASVATATVRPSVCPAVGCGVSRPPTTPSPSPSPTGPPSFSPAPSQIIGAPLDPVLAGVLPDELLGMPFETIGLDPRSAVRNYAQDIGEAIVRHFGRPLDDLMIGLARAASETDRPGIIRFEILALRLPGAALAQMVGAYAVGITSHHGEAVLEAGFSDAPGLGLGAFGTSLIDWSDDVVYVYGYDPALALEMYYASPREMPVVDIYELLDAARAHLGLEEHAPGKQPGLLASPAPAPAAPQIEALLPASVAGVTVTNGGSWESLEGGVDWFTLPAWFIAEETSRSLADAAAAVGLPADNGPSVSAIRFEGLSGDEMMVDVLAYWLAEWGGTPSPLRGAETDGRRYTYTDGWALIPRGATLYWVAIHPYAPSGPKMADYAADVVRSLP